MRGRNEMVVSYLHVPLGQGYCLIGLLEVDVRQDETPLQHHRCLDNGDQTTSILEMPDIGLHRTEVQRLSRRPALAENTMNSCGFDGVSSLCASAMCLDEASVFRADVCLGVDFAHQTLLRLTARTRQACGSVSTGTILEVNSTYRRSCRPGSRQC